ncbi:MAG: SAM-dependent methyltransferase [Deltaproteobacteria bacterium]|nr:SAM-dependent methyltransferase [Deltaproteobacteria bacterium]
MDQRMVISDGVIWYALNEGAWILVSPNRSLKEKCLLIGKEEKAVLDKLLRPQGGGKGCLGRDQMEIARRWLKPEFQIIEEVKDHPPDNLPNQLALSSFQEYVSARSMEDQHDLCHYYGSEIVDPGNQFEEVEMTVSHLYRDPHPALDNMSYGARFARIIMDEDRLGEGMKVLEVGGGTGIFGREFLREVKRSAPEVYGTMQYTFFDISPVLLKSQGENNREHGGRVLFRMGNIRKRQGLDTSYDLVIANEMIADLPVVKMARDELDQDGTASEGWTIGKRLGLDFSDAPPLFIVNLGALEFIAHLAGLLNPGGRGYIVEYGSTWAYPKAYQVVNHREHSIHFGHLLKAARELGLGARLVDLPSFLKLRGDLVVLEGRCHRSLLDHLLPFLGIEMPSSRVYTREMLMEKIPHILPKIENLDFVRLETQDGIVYPKGFYVLILEKR